MWNNDFFVICVDFQKDFAQFFEYDDFNYSMEVKRLPGRKRDERQCSIYTAVQALHDHPVTNRNQHDLKHYFCFADHSTGCKYSTKSVTNTKFICEPTSKQHN